MSYSPVTGLVLRKNKEVFAGLHERVKSMRKEGHILKYDEKFRWTQ